MCADRSRDPHTLRWRLKGRRGIRTDAGQRGVTLVELVLAILIVSIAVSSVLGVLGLTAGRSADPLLARQSLAVAESLLAEILAQPFTANDLDGGANAIGPEAGETRGSAVAPFDHVDDYHGYAMNGIVAANGSAIAGLSGYSAAVTVQPQALGTIGASEGLLVTVTVTAPGGSQVALSGFRARVSP
jgi:MSHA pilin protein MshD